MTETPSGHTLQDMLHAFEEIQYQGVKLTDLHKLRGVMTGDVLDQDRNPYLIGQEEGGVFENVSEHCLMTMIITDVLGEALDLPDLERSNANLAAWFHDAGKKTERMWQRAIEESDVLGEEEIIRLPDVSARKIQALKDVEQMETWENVEAGVPPVVTKLMKTNVPPSQAGHQILAEKIMWFADACLTGTVIKSIKERFNDLENDPKNGQRNIAFSNSFKPKYHGTSLYDVQRKLGDKYAEEFARTIGIKPNEIYSWLAIKVKERIDSGRLPLMST